MFAKSKHRKFHSNRSIRKYLKLGGKYGVGKKERKKETNKERKKERKKERTQLWPKIANFKKS